MMHSRLLSVSARNSPLSKAQVREVLNEIRNCFPNIEFDVTWVETKGDLDLKTSLREMEKSDFFTQEVDELVLKKKCRIAIHSAKDLPEPIPNGLRIIAITRGFDPSDSLVLREGETIATLRPNAKIGTSSQRREEMIRSLRPDLLCVDIRGKIDHRLQLLDHGNIDGLIVAEAALIRLLLTHRNRFKLFGATAPLQGKLAVLAREEDVEMAEFFAEIDDR